MCVQDPGRGEEREEALYCQSPGPNTQVRTGSGVRGRWIEGGRALLFRGPPFGVITLT